MQRTSLAAKAGIPNVQIFIENPDVDLNNHENNDSKPFYAVSNTRPHADLARFFRLISTRWKAIRHL